MIATLQQTLDDMERGVYDFTKDGKCTGCGECCSRYLPLSEREIKDIKRYIAKHHIKECRHAAPLAEPAEDWLCPFLDGTKPKDKCTIYQVRPQICRAFVCNQPPSKVRANKELFWRTRMPVDMRQEFFGR